MIRLRSGQISRKLLWLCGHWAWSCRAGAKYSRKQGGRAAASQGRDDQGFISNQFCYTELLFCTNVAAQCAPSGASLVALKDYITSCWHADRVLTWMSGALFMNVMMEDHGKVAKEEGLWRKGPVLSIRGLNFDRRNLHDANSLVGCCCMSVVPELVYRHWKL